MNFFVDGKELLKSIKRMNVVCIEKQSFPVLSYVLLSSDGDYNLVIAATDTITTVVDNIHISDEVSFSYCVKANALKYWLENIYPLEKVKIHISDRKLTFYHGENSLGLAVREGHSFPTVIDSDNTEKITTLSIDILSNSISKIL